MVLARRVFFLSRNQPQDNFQRDPIRIVGGTHLGLEMKEPCLEPFVQDSKGDWSVLSCHFVAVKPLMLGVIVEPSLVFFEFVGFFEGLFLQ